jgi:2'-5' RNA ligase
MHGLVSLLPEPFFEEVKEIWQHLEDKFGLKRIKVTPYPHFSWQIGLDYPLSTLETTMIEVCSGFSPFEMRTAGLGVFTGVKPIIYIQVVKSPWLNTLHQLIWEKFSAIGEGISPFYHPDFWTPHISLAYEDITEKNVSAVMTWLAAQNFSWDMKIDNLAFIYEPSGKIGEIKYHFPFQK